MGRPTILQVVASDQRRGAETFATQLERFFRDAGLDPTTVALRRTEGPHRLDLPVVGDGRRFSAASLRALAGAVRAHDVTVVHGSDGLLPVAALSPVVRRPFVYRNIGDPDQWVPSRLPQLRVGEPLRRAAAVVALFDAARTSMVRRYRLDPARVTTAPNAVDVDLFPAVDAAGRAAARAAAGIGPADRVVGYLGALSPEKRPDLAVEAVARLEGVHLRVAGTGPTADGCAEVAGRLAPGRVTFEGQTDAPAEFLSTLDALVLPSRTEGLPGVLVEAALLGVPVVATAVGGVPEFVARTGSGVVVDGPDRPADVLAADLAAALADVLAGPGRFRADRDEVAAAYGLQSVAARWVEVVEGVLRRR